MIYVHKASIHMSDTDMTGALYFTNQFRLALEAFENLVKEEKGSMEKLLQGPFLLPIVHTEGDFFAPVKVGDEMEIELTVQQIGSSSFGLKTNMFKLPNRERVGESLIVHVVMDKKTQKSIPIPEELDAILRKYS